MLARGSAAVASHEVFPLVEIGRDGNVEKTHHHLFVGLLAPPDILVRIGIMRVLARVVIPGDRLENGSRFQREWLGQLVAQLPFEIPADLEQGLDAAVRMNQIVFELFSTPVHMRKEPEQRRVVRQRSARCRGGSLAKTKPTPVWSIAAWPMAI